MQIIKSFGVPYDNPGDKKIKTDCFFMFKGVYFNQQ